MFLRVHNAMSAHDLLSSVVISVTRKCNLALDVGTPFPLLLTVQAVESFDLQILCTLDPIRSGFDKLQPCSRSSKRISYAKTHQESRDISHDRQR